MVKTGSMTLYKDIRRAGKVCSLFHNGKSYLYKTDGSVEISDEINMNDMRGACRVNTISILATAGVSNKYSLCIGVEDAFLEKEVQGFSQAVLTKLTVATDYLKVCTRKECIGGKNVIQTIFIYSTHINLNEKLKNLQLI